MRNIKLPVPSNHNLVRRMGRFYIDNPLMDERPEEVGRWLAQLQFIPLRVECLGHRQQYEMIGMSPYFEQQDAGALLPTFWLDVWTDEEGRSYVSSIKKQS